MGIMNYRIKGSANIMNMSSKNQTGIRYAIHGKWGAKKFMYCI